MKQRAINESQVNRMSGIPSDATEVLTISKAADSVNGAGSRPVVAISGVEDNSSVLAPFAVVGQLNLLAETVVAPTLQCTVNDILIVNRDSATHVFSIAYAVAGTIMTVTLKPGDMWSWKDGYMETTALGENDQ